MTPSSLLARDSTVPAQVAYPGCKVLAGRWVDSYTGTAYEDLTKVSIDHLVPLKQAWRSGASTWSTAKLVAFGNDVDRVQALKVIVGSGNAAKGDKDPGLWKPPLRTAWADYARAWLTVKVAYELTADQAEAEALRTMLAPTSPTPLATTPPPPPTTRAPTTTRSPATATTSSATKVVTAGAFCSPAGATGVTSTGKAMRCTTTPEDARNRWRAA